MATPVPYAPSSPHSGSPSKQPKVIGPASTLKLVTKEYAINPLPASTPGAIPKGHHWVDLTDQGTIVVIEQPDGQSCAAIGGIMALRMKVKGAKGCVVGGRVRDLEELRNCGLPVSADRASLLRNMYEQVVLPCLPTDSWQWLLLLISPPLDVFPDGLLLLFLLQLTSTEQWFLLWLSFADTLSKIAARTTIRLAAPCLRRSKLQHYTAS